MIIQPPGWYDKRNLSKFVLCILPGKDRGMKTLWRTFERRTTKRNLQRRGIMKERRKDKHVIVTKEGQEKTACLDIIKKRTRHKPSQSTRHDGPGTGISALG